MYEWVDITFSIKDFSELYRNEGLAVDIFLYIRYTITVIQLNNISYQELW